MKKVIPEQFDAIVDSPIGKLGIVVDGDELVTVSFLLNDKRLQPPRTALAKSVRAALRHYFEQPSYQFDIPIKAQGTVLQNKIWQALTKIRLGKCLTYGELATRLKTSPRVIGNACRENPTPLVVPCHRIIARSGLGGFSGQRDGQLLVLKAWLLKHEGAWAA